MPRMTDEEVKEVYFRHLMDWSKNDLAKALLDLVSTDQIREELKSEVGLIEAVDGVHIDV